MQFRTVYVAADHGGINLARAIVAHLQTTDVNVVYVGPECAESCDYPPFAGDVCRRILADNVEEDASCGILVCGSGIGMSITANRFGGIRSALCHNGYTARLCRQHNNANVLSLGERVLGVDVAMDCVDVFLNTGFDGGRHQRRIDLIEDQPAE